jgi:GxxExxY protein
VSTGLLFDFAKESLVHRRVNYEPLALNGFHFQTLLANAPDLGNDHELATALCRSIGQVLATHSFGYRDTTYRGLLAAEFNAEGLGCLIRPTASVRVEQRRLGETRCDCLVVGQRFGVQVLALRLAIAAADIAILRTHLRLLDLPHGLILNFGKTALHHCWVRCSHANPAIPEIGDGQERNSRARQ